ncbi:chitobiase/beta-hexosaminidase C-terminal domain-containing protein [Sanguibacter sp. Leaf3]|uniref:chitobiase/beta-hexosaminidase C-terminal domain-containing protein n=1 Tax=Sanguibacter sp. Leaf3 TaxID=1736209 RepID=UPI0006FD29F2|nr:chitobiase/beta-hexosaminidase C-terminal domain-containing protein [Sanguibacter sp. Leaf3]KQT96590.1 hypothetical protein ASG53_16050 [Sanguibacter sp. Leaf3]
MTTTSRRTPAPFHPPHLQHDQQHRRLLGRPLVAAVTAALAATALAAGLAVPAAAAPSRLPVPASAMSEALASLRAGSEALGSQALADVAADAPTALARPVVLATYTGEAPALPAQVEVTAPSGTRLADVVWDSGEYVFDQHYRSVMVSGTVEGTLAVEAQVDVVPRGVEYLVDSGGAQSTPPFDAVAALAGAASDGTLRNTVADQQASTGWGYVNDGDAYVGLRASTNPLDKDAGGLWARGSGASSRPIVYRLPLEAGEHTVTAGFREWWSGPRTMSVTLVSPSGARSVVTPEVTVSNASGKTTAMVSATVTVDQTGTSELRVERAAGSEAPTLGWFAVAAGRVDVDTAPVVVAAPTITPGDGAYSTAQTVSVSTATPGASVYVTTDGSEPSRTHGTLYTEPFVLDSTTTVKARAIRNGTASAVSTARLSIELVPEGGYDAVPVGKTWFDTDGNPIQAHGGGFLEKDGWYYWVGENKSHDGAVLLGVSLYKSQDLKNWQYVKELVTQDTAPELVDSKWERPKLVYNEKTDTFVLWGHWERAGDYSASHLVVATSPTVDGDYSFVKHFRPGVGEITTEHEDPTYTGGDDLWGYGSRDFTVFKDPDSDKAYLLSSEDHTSMRLYPLTDDYADVDWEASFPVFEGQGREAPAVVKIGEYYLAFTSGQSGWYPNQTRVAWTKDIADPDGWSDPVLVGNNTSFYSQPTNIMTIDRQDGGREYVYMGDRWNSKKLGTSTYVWLPLSIDPADPSTVSLDYRPAWSLDSATGAIDYPEDPLVSQGKPVTADAVDEAHAASVANDGEYTNTATWGDSSAYFQPTGVPFSWTVDLEEVQDLSRVDLSFRSYNGSESYHGYTVSGSVDGTTWTQLVGQLGNTTVGFTSDPLSGQYRYVRLDVAQVVNSHNGNAAAWAAGLVEVQVYAHEEVVVPGTVTINLPQPAATGWFTTTPSLAVTRDDAQPVDQQLTQAEASGAMALAAVPGAEYRLDDGDWLPYTGPVPVGDGRHVAQARATDDGVPSTEVTEVTLDVDTTAPTATVSVDAARLLTVTAADDTSGVARVEYSLDGGPWATASAPVQLGDAAVQVRARAVDVAGLVSLVSETSLPALAVDPEPTVDPTDDPTTSAAPGTGPGAGGGAVGTPAGSSTVGASGLAATGTSVAVVALAALLLAAGGALVVRRNRRTHQG